MDQNWNDLPEKGIYSFIIFFGTVFSIFPEVPLAIRFTCVVIIILLTGLVYLTRYIKDWKSKNKKIREETIKDISSDPIKAMGYFFKVIYVLFVMTLISTFFIVSIIADQISNPSNKGVMGIHFLGFFFFFGFSLFIINQEIQIAYALIKRGAAGAASPGPSGGSPSTQNSLESLNSNPRST